MDMEVLEREGRRLQAHLKHMPEVIEKIRYRREPINLSACYDSLSGDHIALGVHAYFINGHLQDFKQQLHVASKLKAAGITVGGWDDSMDSPAPFLCALLSDSAGAINTLSHLESEIFIKNRDNARAPQFAVHMLQLALRGEYEALLAKVEQGGRQAGKMFREKFANKHDFFSLLIERNQPQLERLIADEARFWEDMQRRGKELADPLWSDFMATTSMLHAKLCWTKGIFVQISHPLVPEELLPVAPLHKYNDIYDFLDTDWIPPKHGLLSRVSRWFGR